MSTVLLQKSTRAIAWLIAASVAIAFAAPQALAFENLGTFRYQWVSQSGTISADGTAHEVAANPGDTVSMSLSITNRSTNAAALVMYGASAILDEGADYPHAHKVGLGTSHPRDNVPAWIDSSSFAINGNRFTYYDGEPVNPGEDMTLTFDVKITSTAANGTYDLYTEIVREWDGWAQQVTAAGVPIGNGDIFWRFLIGGTVTGGGDLNVATSSTTPPDGNVAILAADVIMAKINFSAGASDNALVSSIAVRRTNLSADDNVNDIKLYDGATKLGSTQALNTTTHKATFTGLSWLIPAGTTKTLTIKGSIPDVAVDTGMIITLGIQSASDVVLSGGGTVAGSFPAYGNEFTIGGITVGYLGVTAPGTPAATNVISGSTDQDLASFKFLASSGEGFDVNSITLTEIGTSVDSDVTNLKLKYVGNQIGSTVPAISNGEVTFTGSPLFSVKAGTSKTIYVVGDIAEGITSARNIRFEINDTPDVVAYGQNSSGVVTITADASGTVYTAAQGQVMTIRQGTLTVVKDPTNLTAQTYIVGEEQVEISKFKFSAGSREGLKITKLIFNEDSTAISTDYQNARLYIDDSTTPVSVGGSVSTTTITFEDTNGLFEVPKSSNTVVTLKIDVSTSASAGVDFRIGIGAAAAAYTNITMYGLTSDADEKINQDSAHMTLTNVDDGSMNTHVVAAAGTLVVSNGPSTPAAAKYSVGTTGFEFMQFRMQALSEAARVTALTVTFYLDAGAAGAAGDDTPLTTGDVTNAKLYYWDGVAWVFLDDVISPSTGVATFSFDHTIPKNTTETFKVTADIPTSSAATATILTGVAGTGEGLNIYDEVTATGVSSSADYSSASEMTGSADSSLFTYTAPTLTVAMSTVPAARSLILNSTDTLFAKFFLTANDVEDVKISTIKIYTDDDADDLSDDSTGDADFGNVYLRFDDGGTWRTTTPKSFTDTGTTTPDYITYSGTFINEPNEWIVPKGGSIIVEIRGDVVATTGTDVEFGFTAAVTNLVSAGFYSGTNAAPSGLGSVALSPVVTLADTGSLAIVVATDSPEVQMATASYGSTTSSMTMTRFKLTATNEDIDVDAIRVTTSADGVDDNFASDVDSINIYEGGTIASNTLTGGTLVGSGTLVTIASAPDAVDIIFDTTVTIPVDESRYLTIVADLNSITGGADSMDVPKIGMDQNIDTGIWDSTYSDSNDLNIRAVGVSSGTRINTASAGSIDLVDNALLIVKTALGAEVHSGSPSGTGQARMAGTMIYKFNLTNTSAQTDSRFRQASSIDDDSGAETATNWNGTGESTVAADTTRKINGANSITWTTNQFTATDELWYHADTPDLFTNFTASADTGNDRGARVSFWIAFDSPTTGIAATDLDFVMDDDTNFSATNDITYSIPAISEDDTWHRCDFAIDTDNDTWDADTDYLGLAVMHASNLDGAKIWLDHIVVYYDSIKLTLAGNGYIFDLDGDANSSANTYSTMPVFTLKDSNSGATLATGMLSGTDTGSVKLQSTSFAEVTFIPDTGDAEIAISSSGRTLEVEVDTGILISAAGKTLGIAVGLGSATGAGVITQGNILWHDNGLAAATATTDSIGWVDSDSNMTRNMTF